MCGGLRYIYLDPETGESIKWQVYFSVPHAKVPVIEEGKSAFYQWGKRQNEDGQVNAPVCGWVGYDQIYDNYWQTFKPDLRLVPAIQFSDKEKLSNAHWFDVPKDLFLLGLKISRPEKSIIYIVTNQNDGAGNMPLLVHKNMVPVEPIIDEIYRRVSHCEPLGV